MCVLIVTFSNMATNDYCQSSPKNICVPATSVASERVFSSAGDIVSAQRSCLHSDHVDKLLFLKKNMRVH